MKSAILFLFAIFSFSISAQDYTKERLLKNAKDGYLLFRLPTQGNKIEALRKAGHEADANKLQSEMEDEQLAWISAFKAEYTYGKVYFFYDINARAIVSRDLTSVFDFNFNTPEELESNFLVGGPDRSETFNMKGIILLTPEMEDVPKGMPYFISSWGFAHLHRKSYLQMVKELNTALSKY